MLESDCGARCVERSARATGGRPRTRWSCRPAWRAAPRSSGRCSRNHYCRDYCATSLSNISLSQKRYHLNIPRITTIPYH